MSPKALFRISQGSQKAVLWPIGIKPRGSRCSKKDLEIQYLFIQVEFVVIDERLTNLRQAWFGKKWSKVDQKLEKRCFEEKMSFGLLTVSQISHQRQKKQSIFQATCCKKRRIEQEVLVLVLVLVFVFADEVLNDFDILLVRYHPFEDSEI